MFCYPHRHLSTISVEDLSTSDGNRHSNRGMSRTMSERKKTHSVVEIRDPALYTSAENLPGRLESIGERHEKNIQRPLGSMDRASSCINLVIDYDKHPEKKRYVSHLTIM